MAVAALRNCAKCGKLFTPISSSIKLCVQCEKDEQDQFNQVKEYLKEHAKATVIELTKATGVERKQIYEWVKSGRLDIASVLDLGLSCESCGKSIKSGRFCIECAARIESDARKVLAQQDRTKPTDSGSRKDRAGFHVADSIRRRRGY
jgi:flagellar operon protein (TIGR03826 family)